MGIQENNLNWNNFWRYSMEIFLSKIYYDGKIKVFHEHKLGQLTMEYYMNRFIEMLRYVPYIHYKNIKN